MQINNERNWKSDKEAQVKKKPGNRTDEQKNKCNYQANRIDNNRIIKALDKLPGRKRCKRRPGRRRQEKKKIFLPKFFVSRVLAFRAFHFLVRPLSTHSNFVTSRFLPIPRLTLTTTIAAMPTGMESTPLEDVSEVKGDTENNIVAQHSLQR